MESRKLIIMLGTRSDSCGGIASVVQHYESDGFFQRSNVQYLATHCSGTPFEKIGLFGKAMLRVLFMSIARQLEIAHVHVAINSSFWRKFFFLLIFFFFRIPSVLHVHAGRFPEFYEVQCGPMRRRLIRFAFNRVDRIIVVSNELNRWIRSVTAAQDVVTICNPAVVRPANEPVFRTVPTLLFLGHIEGCKGAFDLLQAMATIVIAYPNAKLQLCGDGQLEEANARVRSLGLENNVDVLGWIGQQHREELLQQASVFVLPSHFEGLPMSLLEAMGSGLPVVATAVGGVPEAVTDGVEGLLVEPGNVAALAAAVVRLLSNPEDRQRMGSAGQGKVAARFSRRRAVKELEDLYEQLITSRSTKQFKRPPCGERDNAVVGTHQVLSGGRENEDLV